MNVIDSSAWLEYFADSPLAAEFPEAISDLPNLIVPIITIFEVYKRASSQRGEEAAMACISEMTTGRVVLLDIPLALEASRASMQYKLSMADSIIYATAQRYNATVWTTDKHFKDLPDVRYFEKR